MQNVPCGHTVHWWTFDCFQLNLGKGVYWSGFSRVAELIGSAFQGIYFEELAHVTVEASMGQASRLAIQVRVYVTVLSPKPGKAEFLCGSLKAEFLLLQETSVFAH